MEGIGQVNKDIQKRNLRRPINTNFRLRSIYRALRLDMDPDECAMYILTFFFYKYINDIFRTNENGIHSSENIIFVIPEKCSFDLIYKNRNKKNIGNIINEVFEEIENLNEDKLKGVLSVVDFNSEKLGRKNYRNLKLIHLIEEFSDINFNSFYFKDENNHIAGNIFYNFFSRYFFMMRDIRGRRSPVYQVEILTELLEPEEEESICDPMCNIGFLLLSFSNLNKNKNLLFHGQEKNRYLWALCKMALYLHGIYKMDIDYRDVFTEPILNEDMQLKKFDIVISDIHLEKRESIIERVRRERDSISKYKEDHDHISHIVKIINDEKGRVGLLVPYTFLFSTDEHKEFWKEIFDENLLDAVIGLPGGISGPGDVRKVILLFSKNRTTSDVLFMYIDKNIRRYLKRLNRDKNIEKLIKIYKEYCTIDKFSYRANLEEIKKNNFSIDISLYLHTEEKEKVDIKTLKSDIEELEIELQKVKNSLNQKLKEIK